MTKTHDTPSEVTAEETEVHVDGPDGVAVSMTSEAAEETAGRLVDGAAKAAGQRTEKRWAAEQRSKPIA